MSDVTVVVQNQTLEIVVSSDGQTAVAVTNGISVATVQGLGLQGPAGPQGPAGTQSLEFVQASPAASWSFQHNLGRKPIVTIYVGGQEVLTDITADAAWVYITFADAQSGSLILA